MSRLRVPATAIRRNSTFATSENAAPATTSRKATSQSAAPATKKTTRLHWHASRVNDLKFCDLGAPKRAFRARLPPLFTLWRTGLCRSACAPPNGEKLTTHPRPDDDDTTNTRRTQVQPQTPTIKGNPSLRIREKAHLPSHDGHLSGKGSSTWSNFPQQCSATRTHQTHQHYSFKQWFNWAAGKTFKLIFFRWNNKGKHLHLEPITRFRNTNSGGNFRLKA